MRRRTDPKEPISFGQAYAQSDTFQQLFRDGMRLVEETAAYLDGDGRTASQQLSRPLSILYATESMRLTTRLMQLASWLLLHRSVREGDMSPSQANEEKRKIRIEEFSVNSEGTGWTDLPASLRGLIDRSRLLQKRIEQIDAALLGPAPVATAPNAVTRQLQELAAAFEARD
jgi:regulator of CtrA degradation